MPWRIPRTTISVRRLKSTVLPSRPLPPLPRLAQDLVPGLKLSPAGSEGVVVERTSEEDWLSKVVKPGQAFVLEGYFEVGVEDTYQFQLRASMDVQIAVDGQTLAQPASGDPKYLPLRAGRRHAQA